MYSQCRTDCFDDRLFDGDVVAETDLAFSRVDVDVDLVRWEIDEKNRGRFRVALTARVGFADRIGY